jgi:hypothetical protein
MSTSWNRPEGGLTNWAWMPTTSPWPVAHASARGVTNPTMAVTPWPWNPEMQRIQFERRWDRAWLDGWLYRRLVLSGHRPPDLRDPRTRETRAWSSLCSGTEPACIGGLAWLS